MQVFGEESSGLKNGKSKRPRQDLARHVRGQARRPLWLEQSKEGSVRSLDWT